ncbi:hypothetical protein [Hydrogenophaga atypica]|uniref:hypothetical protein n=1 Tax=Hydrogenophaga atypica TaxID=249409 RepID=UPI0036D34BE1
MSKARAAMEGGDAAWAVQSTGEKVAVALALNRADWLASMNYTMAEAIERAGPVWISLLPRVVRALDRDA